MRPPVIPAAHSLAAAFTVDRRPVSTLLEMAFLAPFIDGSEPFARWAVRDRQVAPVDLLPSHVQVERILVDDTTQRLVARGDGCSVLIEAGQHRVRVVVTTAAQEDADREMAQLLERLPPEDERDSLIVRFWHMSRSGPQGQARRIQAAPWSTIAPNYPRTMRDHLAQLMSTVAPAEGGRVILWHGPPGTGKTTALRALLREWAPWCEAHVVTDPERAFADAAYLVELLVAAGAPPWEAGSPRPWKVLIAEDADDYLRADADERASAALGRLLSVGDGLLGQGLRALVLLTTNHPLVRLHPALVRPGRCLAKIEFRPFRADEAAGWLGEAAVPPRDGGTLAELYELRGDIGRIGFPDNSNSTGLYL